MQVDGVQHGAPDVELPLVGGSVANPDGAGAVVAAEPLDSDLGKVPFAVDAVHDLQVILGGDVADEGKEVVGFPVQAEGVQGPERERGIAHPRVPVVPVPLSPGRLGQRRGGRRDQGSSRCVGEALQRQRAALQRLPPRVVGELARR